MVLPVSDALLGMAGDGLLGKNLGWHGSAGRGTPHLVGSARLGTVEQGGVRLAQTWRSKTPKRNSPCAVA